MSAPLYLKILFSTVFVGVWGRFIYNMGGLLW